MANYKCSTEECPEYDVAKWGIADVPASDVTCGACGNMSLVETDENPPGDEPPYVEPPEPDDGPQPEEATSDG